MPRKKISTHEESSKVEECLTKDELSSEEDSIPEVFTEEKNNIVVEASETCPLANSDIQKECTKNIDEILEKAEGDLKNKICSELREKVRASLKYISMFDSDGIYVLIIISISCILDSS